MRFHRHTPHRGGVRPHHERAPHHLAGRLRAAWARRPHGASTATARTGPAPHAAHAHGLRGTLRDLRPFLLLWSTQTLSQVGSSMTGFALVIWIYQQQGSALASALLTVCSYAPYVLCSLLAGTLSDRWDKKTTMLVSDAIAAAGTVTVFALLTTGSLQVWHLYLLNALNGLTGSVQQPASEVATSLLTPRRHYQLVGALRSFSYAVTTMLTPVLATALLAFAGLTAVIMFDLATFSVAFVTLAGFIRIPGAADADRREGVLQSAALGLRYLAERRGVLGLILFMAAVNLFASMYDGGIAPLILSRTGGDRLALGTVNACAGAAMVAGSVVATMLPQPGNRVRMIVNAMQCSFGCELFLLALTRSLPCWCLGAVCGWIMVPLANTNLDALLRSAIPPAMQGRVYAARNALQYCTIPVGYLLSGALIDRVFEPFMAGRHAGVLTTLFGAGKGSGAAMLFLLMGVCASMMCLLVRRDRRLYEIDGADVDTGAGPML